MGKVTKFTLVKKDSQLRQLETGPISILMARNLRNSLDKSLANPLKKTNEGES
tara:strand:- start:391 stop:549 length:159 start_codon:yes stop_codon:yes gene_type:complete